MIKNIIIVGAVALFALSVLTAYAVGYTDGWERMEKWQKTHNL